MNNYRNILPAFRQATRFLIGLIIMIAFILGLTSGVLAWVTLFPYMLGFRLVTLEITLMFFIGVIVEGCIVMLLADKVPMRFKDIARLAELESYAFKGTLVYVLIAIAVGFKVFLFP